MKSMLQMIKDLYLAPRLYQAIGAVAVLHILSYFFRSLTFVAEIAGVTLLFFSLIDMLLLFRQNSVIFARRELPERFSNGDENNVRVFIENRFAFQIQTSILDELPFQFQIRDAGYAVALSPGETRHISYTLRPVARGEYHFGTLNVYVSTPVGLIKRRFRFETNGAMVPAYPSFIQMRKYELMAISNRLTEAGIKKVRRIGHTMEFDQIREYVRGDDHRTINWKATARKRALMVNHYQDERSQQVYSVIDMGRVMQMPFNELSLLDYAINASLVISNIALLKQDRAGIITFSHKIGSILPAERTPGQMRKVMETLYNQRTDFLESDHQSVYLTLLRRLNQRSLILLFTNFETLTALKRQLTYLRRIARRHLLVVIFFENTELKGILHSAAETPEMVYRKTIAEQFSYEKRQIVKELQRSGIFAILTSPENLTVATINQYLQLKARGLI
ncbi:MAG: DUF58 domain-containing protein [Calditrichia bacterium]